MTPDISVIVVSYNTGAILAECVASLLDADQATALELIVIENATSAEAIRNLAALQERYAGDRRARFIQNQENRGFAAANNQGLLLASARNLFLLNPDTWLAPGILGSVVQQLDNAPPEVGILGFRLENPDGAPQVAARTLPTWQVALNQNTFLGSLGLFGAEVRRHKLEGFTFDQTREVGQVMGAAFAFPRRTLERLGPLDEGYFVYFEEVDYCRRAQEAGLRVLFSPVPAIRHFGGVSTAQAADCMYGVYLASLLHYQRKWLPTRQYRWVAACLKVLLVPSLLLDMGGLSLNILKNKLRGKPEKVARDRRQLQGRTRFLLRDLGRFLRQS